MESIPISKFKATCLSVLKSVKRTGRPVLITRYGQPVAEVVRPQRRASRADWIDELWVSPISVWEVLVLVERGRVRLEGEPRRWKSLC